nr:MAG TPA: hypothetical protein [Bacteriophage sp.]
MFSSLRIYTAFLTLYLRSVRLLAVSASNMMSGSICWLLTNSGIIALIVCKSSITSELEVIWIS